MREAAILPLLDAWEPEAVVIQSDTCAVADDPFAGLAMSNTALWAVISAVTRQMPRLLFLGGGYNPWSVGRGWAGVWGVLTGVPETWFTALADPLREAVRDAVRTSLSPLPANG